MRTGIKGMDLSDFLLVLFEKLHEKNVKKISGRTKLQKLIFILTREFELPTEINYFLHNFGPYSSELTNEIDTLVTFRLMDEKVERHQDYLKYDYSLTPKGASAAKHILESSGRHTQEAVDKMVGRVVELNGMAVKDLIDYAYEQIGRR